MKMNCWVLTSIITLQTFVTAQGAEKLLNEACVSTDTCVDISGTDVVELTCDILVKRCLIKVGKSCDGTKSLCVNGAFCKDDTKLCTCGTDYNPSNGVCGPTGGQPGVDCSSGSPTCIDDAACTGGLCVCNDGYNLVEPGTCAAVGANTIGASCTATQENTKGSCTDSNAVCSATSGGHCGCKDGYVGIVGGGCSIMPNRVGGLCKTGTAGDQGTCGNKAVCSATTNGVCQCPQDYQGENGDTVCNANLGTECDASVNCVASSVCDNVFGKCLILVGKSCASPNDDKCVSHAECSGGTCACSSGYTSNAAGLCEAKTGSACNASVSCVTSATCNTTAGKCYANIGTECDASVNCVASSVCDNVFGKCLILVGKSCASPNDDKCVSHAECSGGTCACSSGYTSNAAGLCEAKTGSACNASVSCVTSATCNTTAGKCYANIGTECDTSVSCIASSVCDNVFGKCLIKHGATCSGHQDKCVSHAACTSTSSTCTCGPQYTHDDAGLCNANVGTPCNVSVSCVASFVCDNVFGKCSIQAGASCAGDTDKCVSNATCTEVDLCACRDGYTAKEGLCVLPNNGRAPGVSICSLVYMLVAGLCLTVFMV